MFIKQLELGQLREQAQLEREEKKHADEERWQRENRWAQDQALEGKTHRHAKMTNTEDITVFLLIFEQHMVTYEVAERTGWLNR